MITKIHWLKLDSKKRGFLRKLFSLVNDESAVVVDNNVISDGISDNQLTNKINNSILAYHSGKTGNDDELWEALLLKLWPKVEEIKEEIKTDGEKIEVKEEVKEKLPKEVKRKKRGKRSR
jgi:hypothetical protein